VILSVLTALVLWPHELLISETDVVRPDAYTWPVLKAFLLFFLIAHLIVLGGARLGKAMLQAVEYSYLILGVFGLFSITTVGVDEALHGRSFFGDQVTRERGVFNMRADVVYFELCRQTGLEISTASFCQWIDDAKALAGGPLNADSPEDKMAVSAMIDSGTRLSAELPSIKNPDQKHWFDHFALFVGYDAKKSFDYLLQRGSWIAKIDSAIDESQSSLTNARYFGAYLLAFAIALRISKLTIETLGLVRKD
jgi:hypothetical protein